MDEAPVIFKDDNGIKDAASTPSFGRSWKVMIVDDEKSVHDLTVICLREFVFENAGIDFLSAFSSAEARRMIGQHPDTALLIVDVVMETPTAGLELIRYVREEIKNDLVQIVIRTGQPGVAPEYEVISKYRINFYLNKTETTVQKLISLVTTSLRNYQLALSLDKELEKRKEAEKKLLDLNDQLEKKVEERTLQLKRANQLKDQFLANVSHEIRTPMNGIIGMSGLLMGEALSEEHAEYIRIINQSATSLLTILNDILDLSKIESGLLQFENKRFSLKTMMNDIRSLFKLKLEEKHLKFRLSVSEDVPEYLSGDEGRVRQVLINLVGNAVKFTDQGSVSIAISIEENLDTHLMVLFTVEDTGKGIDEKFKTRLFDKFIQQDSSITRKYGGTGLGLTISMELAKLMEGSIEVDNRTGGGAVFKTRLKLKKCSQAAETEGKEAPAANISNALKQCIDRGLRILVAEDNPVNQKVIGLILKKMGLSAVIAGDGFQVLKELKAKEYDLVFMDVDMPGLDGIETTRIIRDPASEVVRKDIPVIALTAFAMKEDKQRCMDAGMDFHMSKPVSPEKILQVLSEIKHTGKK